MNVFDPNLYIKTVTIVGLGGTGAQIARSAARILYDMKARRMHTPQLVLIDPDSVEMKNVGRQLYTAGDVGQPKAHVLMRRFNCALGLNAVGIAEPLNAEKHFERQGGVIVIGAVDNHLARQELSRVKGALWIDCGNTYDTAQVVCGNVSDRDLMLRHLEGKDGKYAYLPNAALVFPQLLEPEPAAPQPTPPVSCAALVEEGSQHLLVNDWVAVVAAQYLYKLMHRSPITSFLSYISSDGIGIRSIPITKDELSAYLVRV
ncbi:MAG: ThiF family adenylyltransferase [Anaerolineae bacterium]|nr:ThiF family adenylyltransferase [Anaerolineae bacterium]